jgi:drug efflux transport system permease protein
MLVKEFIHTFRDPRMRGVVFVMPIVQTLVFGYAVTTDVRQIRTAVYDADATVASRELVERFARSGYFTIVERATAERRLVELMDRGSVQAVLRIDRGFGAGVRLGRPQDLQIIVDGTDSNTAGIVLGYASRIAGRLSKDILLAHSARNGSAGQSGWVELESRAWFNENLESRNFYVPGVIAIVVMLITLMLTSMAVVREREIGTMEQIIVTPITPFEFIVGKTVPFALIALVDVALVAAIGVFWFEVPIRGSLWLLFLGAAVFLLTTLGIGLLLSTVSTTQQQAMMGTFFFYLPAVLLSGFMFPIANMPSAVQWLTLANPLRYFLVILRGIFLKGIGLDVLWPQFAVLAGMGLLVLAVSTSRFKKTLG